MLNGLTKSINLSATSDIEVDGKNNVVMYMSATINSNGDVNINQSIRNKELYIANQDVVDADYAEFKAAVMTYVEG